MNNILYGERPNLGNGTYCEFGSNTLTATGTTVDFSAPPFQYYYGNFIYLIFKSCERVGNCCMKAHSSLQTVTFSDNLKSIGSECFAGCSSLDNLTFPSTLTSIENNAFYGCSNLERITSFPEGLTTIGSYAFYGTQLNEIVLPSTLTSVGEGAFADSINLDGYNVTINCSLNALKGSVFYACNNISKIIINNFEKNGVGLGKLAQNLSDGNYMIEAGNLSCDIVVKSSAITTCSNIKYNGSSVVSVENISTPVRKNISNLLGVNKDNIKKVLLPPDTTAIGIGAFADCTSINSVDHLSNVKIIGAEAFSGCTGLTITVPSTVTSIGENAFKNVAHVYYTGSASGKPWGAKAIN